MPLTEDQQKRLDEHRARGVKALEDEANVLELRELAVGDLEIELTQALGTRGVEFEIVDNKFGVFAVKKPDVRGIKTWETSTDKQKQSLEWMIAFLRHYIVPEANMTLWMTTCAERPGLCWQTATTFLALLGVEVNGLEKKR